MVTHILARTHNKSFGRSLYGKLGIVGVLEQFHLNSPSAIIRQFWWPGARAYYHSQRAKGKEHHAAVRALAFKWMRIIWKCWQTRTPYNEVLYLEMLRKKGSSLLKFAADYQR
jgi:hypothetical protein